MNSPSDKQKLWLDDVRPAPDGWTWVKSLAEAKDQILAWVEAGDEWGHASLDHDLGAPENAGMYARGDSKEGSGYDLVEWMCDEDRLPTESCRVHSWNNDGAKNMAFMLKRFLNYAVVVKRYEAGESKI